VAGSAACLEVDLEGVSSSLEGLLFFLCRTGERENALLGWERKGSVFVGVAFLWMLVWSQLHQLGDTNET